MEPCDDAAYTLVSELAPESLLYIGARGSLTERLRPLAPTIVDAADPVAALKDLGRFDFALLAGLDTLPRSSGEHLLARLRDLHGGRFAVQVGPEGESQWPGNELLAFGLVLLARCGREEAPARLYGFDIATYKPTPDWLNPKFWAHPERWDRYWW